METMLPNSNDFTTHQEARAHGHELFRHNVVEAANHLLVTEGPEALTVRRVAKALKCSTKIIYTTFSGKDGLATALYLKGCMHLNQMISSVPQVESPRTYVQEIAWVYWRFALANPGYYGVMFGGAIPRFQPSASSKQMITQALEAVARILHTYMTQGLLSAQDPVRLTKTLWAPLHGVVSLHLLGHFPDEQEAKQIFERTVQAMTTSLETTTPPEVL